MYNTNVNRNLTDRLPNPGMVLSIPFAYKQAIRYFTAGLSITMLFLICTSYERSQVNPRGNEPEYISQATATAFRTKATDSAFMNQPVIRGETIRTHYALSDFYILTNYRPVWIHTGGLSRRASVLIDLIERARDYGLEPEHYHLKAISEIRQILGNQSLTDELVTPALDFEMLMTDAAMCLMAHLRAGYVVLDSVFVTQDWYSAMPSVLYEGIKNSRVEEAILSVQPKFVEYLQLQRATQKFVQSNVLTDHWSTIDFPSGDTVLLLQQIQEVLITLGYLRESSRDHDFTAALKQFQHFHGLNADGRPGKNTVEALGQSTMYRYRKLALNLDRLRKQGTLDTTLLYVNIPSYQLKIYSGNILKDTFRIIVGHPSSPTPQLIGTMERIITNPVWYVPRSITMNEILPRLKTDTGYLRRNGFKILDEHYRIVNEQTINLDAANDDNFNYTIRQNRGSENALGQMKFLFSNPYTIYLHDTPGKALFSKDIRAFSHGCIRIKDPERLAGFIIREVNAQETDIAELMQNGRHHEIEINARLPIHIRYITCEADHAGNLYFYKDIYGLDDKEMDRFDACMGI